MIDEWLPTRTFEVAVHGQDIAARAGIRFNVPDAVLAHVIAMRGEEAEPAAEAAAAPAATAEPEVIKKGKKEEEAAAEEKGKKK